MNPTASVYHILCKSGKKCDGDPGNDQTGIWERKHELYTEGPTNTMRLKKARKVKRKVKSMFIIFFDIQRIVHKEFVLAGQTVNSEYYCDVLWQLNENVR
jgi:hypothetical protein